MFLYHPGRNKQRPIPREKSKVTHGQGEETENFIAGKREGNFRDALGCP
jgi:hypothetical protein